MATLNIMVEEAQGDAPVSVMHLQGDIDAATHSTLTAKAEELVGAGTKNILLDLSGVGYMGSAGFRALPLRPRRTGRLTGALAGWLAGWVAGGFRSLT